MRIFIRVIAFALIIFLWVYFYNPSLFQKKVYDLDTININKYVLTPNPAKIYLLNLKISSTSFYNKDSLAWYIQLYFDSIYTFNINIMELLENSSNKKTTLITHIKQLQSMQNKLENAISLLENQVNDEQVKYEEYITQKQQWDQEFWEWFIQKDANLSIQWFNDSYKNGPIATKHRIVKNASLIVLNKLKKIKFLIDSKTNVLDNNTETIIDNFDIIKWNLLRKLQIIKYQLEENTYTE